MEYLIEVVQKLSLARTLEEIIDITRHAARELTGADGAAFVLREQDKCYYVEEDAIGPLWKGKKFPMSSCISGWAMKHKKSVAIKDIFEDPRIPLDAYRPTFVKSLLVVPIRVDSPIGAVGNYWADTHVASPEQIRLLEALASSTSVALENIQLYKDLKEANAYLRESLQARDEFFEIASHELRTPLSALTLELQMAERKLRTLTAQENPLRHSLIQVKKLNLEIEALFDVSQIRSGTVDLCFQRTNVSKLVEAEVERMSSEFDLADCEIAVDIESDVVVDCDPKKIKHILRNLFSNSVRHAAGCRISIALSTDVESYSLRVGDSGPGISPEILKKLQATFERGHTPRRLGGLGLGLFIVKSYVEAHNGTFTIQSSPCQGPSFEARFAFENLPIEVRSSATD